MMNHRIIETKKRETPTSIIITETIEREYGIEDFKTLVVNASSRLERIEDSIKRMLEQKENITKEIADYEGYIEKLSKEGVE